jgi:hypothetical protein
MNNLYLIASGIISYIVIRYIIKRKIKESKLRKFTKKYGQEFGTLITYKRIAIGMSLEMVKAAWKQPLKTDGKVIRENYLKQNYYFGAYKDNKDNTKYKFCVIVVNDKVVEIREI